MTSHPAEAATRENGDLVLDLARALAKSENDDRYWRDYINEAKAALAFLSTHQQQGFPVVKVLGHIVNHMAWKDGALIVTVAHQQQGAEGEIQAVKRWPFVESPGDFAARFREVFAGVSEYLGTGEAATLSAMRAILIEQPPTLSKEYLARALYRAPQPDTVTEENREEIIAKAIYGRSDKAWESNKNTNGVALARDAAKRVTAALSAKGK